SAIKKRDERVNARDLPVPHCRAIIHCFDKRPLHHSGHSPSDTLSTGIIQVQLLQLRIGLLPPELRHSIQASSDRHAFIATRFEVSSCPSKVNVSPVVAQGSAIDEATYQLSPS